MNQVLGRNVGHSLEVIESIEYLTNKKKNSRLEIITNELISVLLMMIKKIDKEKSIKEINKVIETGKAAEKFEHMVSLLGGTNNILSSFQDEISKAPYKEDIFPLVNGFVQNINTRDLGIILIELGGGRKQITDKIDFAVGFESVVAIGEKVDIARPLIRIHSRTKENIESFSNRIRECFKIAESDSSTPRTIYETIV